MLVSRKTLPLIHLVSGIAARRTHMVKTLHKSIHGSASTGLRRILFQPFAESGVECFVLRPGYQPRLLKT